MLDFMAQAQALRNELVARRRDFHRHPELAFQEIRTAGIVAEALNELGLEVQVGVGKTGVVALLEGDQPGPTVLVRADMDALPIHEANQLVYSSTVPGKMHACGHDGHTAVLLAVAKLLTAQRAHLRGRVKFVFQPAEEIGQGAMAMVNDGLLRDLPPDVTLGLHLWNYLPLGTLGVADGGVMAGASDFRMVISGKGGHAGAPHSTVDPVVCAAQLISALQTIVSRNVSPLETAVVSVAFMRAGDANNIIPQTVELGGTFRTFTLEMRDYVERRLGEISSALCQAMGCTVEITTWHYTIPVVNDSQVAQRLRRVFAEMVGTKALDTNARTLAADDVSFLMQDAPGMYFFVGCANSSRGLDYGHHHPQFDFDEDALPLAAALLAAAAAEYVLPEEMR